MQAAVRYVARRDGHRQQADGTYEQTDGTCEQTDETVDSVIRSTGYINDNCHEARVTK